MSFIAHVVFMLGHGFAQCSLLFYTSKLLSSQLFISIHFWNTCQWGQGTHIHFFSSILLFTSDNNIFNAYNTSPIVIGGEKLKAWSQKLLWSPNYFSSFKHLCKLIVYSLLQSLFIWVCFWISSCLSFGLNFGSFYFFCCVFC